MRSFSITPRTYRNSAPVLSSTTAAGGGESRKQKASSLPARDDTRNWLPLPQATLAWGSPPPHSIDHSVPFEEPQEGNKEGSLTAVSATKHQWLLQIPPLATHRLNLVYFDNDSISDRFTEISDRPGLSTKVAKEITGKRNDSVCG